jgi:hypothetical protein
VITVFGPHNMDEFDAIKPLYAAQAEARKKALGGSAPGRRGGGNAPATGSGSIRESGEATVLAAKAVGMGAK